MREALGKLTSASSTAST